MWDLLLSAGSGGLLGFIGTGVKLFGKFKEKKLMLEHEVKMAEQNRMTMDREMALAKVRGELDVEQAEVTTDAANLQAALSAEAAITDVHKIVNDVRGLTRPALTFSLVGAAVYLGMQETVPAITNEITFMSATAVTYWFGDRPLKSR